MTRRPADPAPDAPVPDDAVGLGFDEAMTRVEAIIRGIESGQIGLERSMAEFERGVGLIRRCRDMLRRAEQRVDELTRRLDGPAEGSTPGDNPGAPG